MVMCHYNWLIDKEGDFMLAVGHLRASQQYYSSAIEMSNHEPFSDPFSRLRRAGGGEWEGLGSDGVARLIWVRKFRKASIDLSCLWEVGS